MITITIDQDIKLKKTNFADPLEAIHFLSAFQIKKNNLSNKKTKSTLESAMEDYNNWVNICSQEDLKSLLQKRWILP